MKKLLKIVLILVGLLSVYIAGVFYNQFNFILGATEGPRVNLTKSTGSVLLVIDIQNAYPSEKQLATEPEIKKFIDNTNKVIDYFQGLEKNIVYIAQIKKNNSIRSIFLPHIAAEGSKAAEIHSRIHRDNQINIIYKLRADAFSNSDLQNYLIRNKTGKLYVTGMAAEVCVGETVQGAINRGYQVYVIQDAILALFGNESKQKMLQKYSSLGAKVISIDELKTLK